MVTGEEIRDWQTSDPDVIERIRELEETKAIYRENAYRYRDAINAFLGAWEHGRTEDVQQAVKDLRAAYDGTD